MIYHHYLQAIVFEKCFMVLLNSSNGKYDNKFNFVKIKKNYEKNKDLQAAKKF